jgi:hypothetical protein
MSNNKSEVIFIWGEHSISLFYTPHLSEKRDFTKLLKSIKVYEYDTEDEAEAFREGVAAAGAMLGKDYEEITRKNLKEVDARYKRAKERWRV